MTCPEDCGCEEYEECRWVESDAMAVKDQGGYYWCVQTGCNNNGTCQSRSSYGDDAPENCETCPEDCPCSEGWVCNPSSPDSDEWGCVWQDTKEQCGDGSCSLGECYEGCIEDCLIEDCCGNYSCDSIIGEDMETCPDDCFAECEDHYDCYAGQKCDGGECVDMGPGECIIAQDCEVTAPQIANPVCSNGLCIEGEEYRFSLSPAAGERSMFYSNGKGKEYLAFHAQKMVVGEDTIEWVDAPGLTVSFSMQKGAGGSYSTPLGTLNGDEVTDEQGMAYATYVAPYIRPTSPDFYTSKAINVMIMARANKEGKNLGGADYDIKLYPPIRITAFKAVPLEIDEKGKGLIEFKVEDFLNSEKTAYFETRHAESSFELGGPFTTTGTKKSTGEKFNIYIEPIEGIRSINMDDLSENREILKNIMSSVKKDMAVSVGTGGFDLLKTALKGGKGKVITELGRVKSVSKWMGEDSGKAVIEYVKSPGTYFGGYIVAEGVAGEAGSVEKGEKDGAATGLGGARNSQESAMYVCALAVDGASVAIGIITAPLDLAPGVGQAKDFVVSASLNTIKELALAAAKDYRVGNARMRYYPRVIRARVEDIDGFEVTAWTQFYVRRYE